MSTDQIDGSDNGKALLGAVDARTEQATIESPGPAYADLSDGTGHRKPIIPEHWQSWETARRHVTRRAVAGDRQRPAESVGPKEVANRDALVVDPDAQAAASVHCPDPLSSSDDAVPWEGAAEEFPAAVPGPRRLRQQGTWRGAIRGATRVLRS